MHHTQGSDLVWLHPGSNFVVKMKLDYLQSQRQVGQSKPGHVLYSNNASVGVVAQVLYRKTQYPFHTYLGIRTMPYHPLSCVPKGGYRNRPHVQDSARK